jgi:putative lipoic acid-binding regulatory protein
LLRGADCASIAGMTADSARRSESLIEFPADFPVKVIGRGESGFAQEVLALVLQHAPDFDAARMEMRPSKEGKYLSLTCTVCARSQSQLDALYRALSGHPRVLMVL